MTTPNGDGVVQAARFLVNWESAEWIGVLVRHLAPVEQIKGGTQVAGQSLFAYAVEDVRKA